MNSRNKHHRFVVSVFAISLPLMILILVSQGLANATANANNQVSNIALPSASGIDSDDFNACDLNTELWTFVDPLDDSSYALVNTFTDDAALEIMVPGGSTKHSISASNTDAPRVMQELDSGWSNFEVEAKFDSSLGERFQIQGILIQGGSGDDEFIRFEFFSDGSYIHVYAATLDSSGLTTRKDITITVPGPNESYYLRVDRDGKEWTQSYKIGSDDWTSLAVFTHTLNVSFVGPFAGNSGSPPNIPAHTAHVDYFFNTDSPIVPEDEERNTLTLNANPGGGGSVSKIPNKSSYACNESVTITASPNSGWAFLNWSGDWSGSANPDTIAMTGSRQVTANFSEQSYTLTANTVGMGSVEKLPDQASYLYNDEVTVTANADPGWTFSGWSGDLTGNTNPETITMNDNKSITATFVQDQYTISSTVVGEGDVSWVPVKGSYVYGEVVTFTATPEYAWAFTGWSGDLSGNENPKVVTLTDSLIATANFEQYKVMLPMITVKP